MTESVLEHANITVRNAKATADLLCGLFDWRIRWQGAAKNDGYSVHVGGKDSYVALYTPAAAPSDGPDTYVTTRGLNHLGVVVDDLDQVETRVEAAGYKAYSHGDYEPGRRFYFREDNGVEIEVVAYDAAGG